jgi:SAM-dependent methyltransferase
VLDTIFGVAPGTPLPQQGGKIISDIVAAYLIPGSDLKMVELLRLLGLADALKMTGLSSRHDEKVCILSVGCGEGKHETVVAGRFPNWKMLATDLSIPAINAIATENLEFRVKDLLAWPEDQDFDFVYSIECLEHIEDYPLAFRHLSSKVRRGGWLYLSVPFASAEEQADEQLRKSEWENNRHYVPGFSSDDLVELCRANRLTPVNISAIFSPEPRISLNRMINALNRDYSTILPHLIGILALDVQRNPIPENRNRATGIRLLAQKC